MIFMHRYNIYKVVVGSFEKSSINAIFVKHTHLNFQDVVLSRLVVAFFWVIWINWETGSTGVQNHGSEMGSQLGNTLLLSHAELGSSSQTNTDKSFLFYTTPLYILCRLLAIKKLFSDGFGIV